MPKFDRSTLNLGFCFLLTLAVVVANALVSIHSVRTLGEIATSTIRTRETLAALAELQTAITDAETGQRGFLLSNSPEYLRDFEFGSRVVPVQLENLKALATFDRGLDARVAELGPPIRDKLRELAETIQMARANQLDAALEVVRTNQGKRSMDRIRGLIAEIRRSEDATLMARDDQARVARLRTGGTIALASACAAAMILVAFILARTDIERREKSSRELRDREARYRFLADSLPQVVWTARPDGKLEYFNSPWFDYSGMTQEQSAGDGWAETIHPEDLPRTIEIWTHSLRTGEPYEREFRIRRRDQSYRWFLARALPYRDESGRIVEWVGTVTDIDDQRRDAERLRNINEELEHRVAERTEELQATNRELERSNRELQEFASVASHDLQEPLRKIQAFGDRLRTRSQDALGEQGLDYLDRMQASAARMSTLINDLLTFSRVTTKAQPFARVNLNEIAREVLSDLEARIAQTGGMVEIGPLPTLDADPLQMRQLIQNLIGNALKFRQNEIPPRVLVTAEAVPPQASTNGNAAEPPHCLLKFEDNGIGFDEKYLDRIFNVFQRLHGRSEYEGTGMGLAICRKIVERHGGRITAVSAPGKGASFLVSLPLFHDSPKDGSP